MPTHTVLPPRSHGQSLATGPHALARRILYAIVGLASLIAGPQQAAAQPPAPGGISTGLEYWIRPEEMQASGGGALLNWDDVYNLHTDEAFSAISVTTGFNFHPSASFNGGYMRWLGQQLLSGATAGEAFHVLQRNPPGGALTGSPSEFGGGTVAGWRYDNTNRTIVSGWGSSSPTKQWDPLAAPAGGPPREVAEPHIYHLLSKPGEWTARFDGLANFTTATNTVQFNQSPSTNTYIGASHNSVFRGKMSEVIVYRRELTAAERTQVQSYVATKYGVTLGTTSAPLNYVASDGTTTFWTGSATYQNDVAGIGRDDLSGLVQRQSQSVNTANSGNLVTMGLSTIAVDNASNANNFAANYSFLAWGDDAASASFVTPVPSPALGSMRMTRIWHVQETGTVGPVKVGVPATTAPNAQLYLVVSNDTVFDSTDQWLPMTAFSAGTTSYLAADADFTTGQFFTFAVAPTTDLAITKTDGQSVYVPGQPITYTIVVTNAGGGNATGVPIADAVPAAITAVTASCVATGTAACGTNGSSGNTVSFTGASVAAGAGNQLTITVGGIVGVSTTGNLTNAATVSVGAGQIDPNPANNSASDTDGPAQADLVITKAGPANVIAGQTLTYTLTITNNGPHLATAVSVTDPTPAGLTFVSNTGDCTTAFPCALGDLASGATRTIAATYQVPSTYTSPNPIVNTATVSNVTADPNTANNTATASTALAAPASDLQIVKSVSAAAVSPGQNYTYTLQITNNGPSEAANVVVTDALPANTSFVSSVAGCTAAGQNVTCPTIATMAVGAAATFDLIVQLSPSYSGDGSDILNIGRVTSSTVDPALQNNSNPAGAPPIGPAGADVAIVKTVSAGPINPGETFTYTLLVSNQGPAVAANVVATDPLPAGVTFVSSPQGCTAAGQNVTCPAIASMNSGDSLSYHLVVLLDPSYVGDGSDLPNIGTVATDTADPVPANNTSTPVTPNVGGGSADLSTTKTIQSSGAVSPGMTFTYRVTVANAGPSTAHTVTVTDTLPSAVTFVSSTPASCSAAGQVVTCTLASLASGSHAVFDLLVRLDPAYAGDGSDILNTASAASSTPDPEPSDNTSAAAGPLSIGVGSADLSVTLTGPYGPVPAGSDITYTIVVTNQGPNAALGVTLDGPTPSGLTFVAASGDCTTPFPCALGTLLPGQTRTITVRYSVPPSTTVVTYSVETSSSTPDPSLPNNSATVNTPADPVTYYLAEGATGTFWDEDILIANPNDTPAPVTVRFFREDGATFTQTLTVAALSHVAIRVDDVPGLEATVSSAQVTSDSGLPLAVERTMTWDATGYGGHTETAVTQPSRRWYFAEGAQGYFDTYLLLENANDDPAEVTVTFLREGNTPFVKTLTMIPHSRNTVQTRLIPELASGSFGMVVDATQPIVAERSMYFGTIPTRLWSGGHSSAGVTAPSARWFYAEGATGSFFTTFILLSNPQSVDAHVTLDYLLPDGTTIPVTRVVPAQGRLTVRIDDTPDPRLQNTAVSTRITSDVPIVTERSMYWDTKPDVTPWSEGHNSFGVDLAAARWGLADGRVGQDRHYHTYVLLSNPWATPADVTVTFLRDSAAPIVKTYTVPATTRFTIDVNADVPELQNEWFGARVEVTNGFTINVERSIYWSANGVFWAAGTNAAGTRLP